MRFDELAARDVVIWGAGREGMAAHRELAGRGIGSVIAVTGTGPAPDGVVTGDAAWALLQSAGAIVKSPGIPHTFGEYIALRDAGVPITSLMDLWLTENRNRVIAVTGTKGKSTTSALVQHILTALGRTAELAGNIGIPVGAHVGDDIDCAVTEVSSYQAAELTASPRVAVITSLYPEHLPWHGGFENYVADKLRLAAFGPDTVVVPDPSDDLGRRVRAVAGDARMLSPASLGIAVTERAISWDGAGSLALADMNLVGTHNLTNAALALAAVDAYGGAFDRSRALEAVATFAPLAHRLEVVPSGDGRTWIDDGLATAPQAVAAALTSVAAPRIALIAGGSERDLDFSPIVDALAGRDDVELVCTGPAGARLAREAQGRAARIHVASGFADAVAIARSLTASGDAILLSPGAPSFDEFADYEARAAAFRGFAAEHAQ